MAYAIARGQLEYYRLLERSGEIRTILRRDEVMKDDKVGVMVAMEGADPIIAPSDVPRWFDDGLRVIGLAHYGPGRYAMGTGDNGPLTAQGFELLREMERVGMILDLTHCAEPGWQQAIEKFGGRVLASHNNCRALVGGDRQFSDEQIRMLIERDAVIGVALDSWMLCRSGWVRGQTPREAVTLADVADQVDHICQVAGNAKHVGIGSDLDGGFGTEQTPAEIETIADLPKLEGVLRARGSGDEDVAGIFYGNW